jgi:hypothetical protein
MPFKVANSLKLTIAVVVAFVLVVTLGVLSGGITRAQYAYDCKIVYKAEVTTYNGRMAVAHYEVPAIREGN